MNEPWSIDICAIKYRKRINNININFCNNKICSQQGNLILNSRSESLIKDWSLIERNYINIIIIRNFIIR